MNGNGHSIRVKLDPATGQVLEHLAQAWGVSKEEAVKRAVAQTEAPSAAVNSPDRLQAFQDLQRRPQLTPEKAAAWQTSVREGRR